MLAALTVAGGPVSGSSGAPPPSASVGVVMNRPVSAEILELPLQDQQEQNITLSNFRGKVLFLSRFSLPVRRSAPSRLERSFN